MSDLNQIIAPVADEFCRVKESLREVIISHYPTLGDISRTLLAQRGKMMRPMLTLLAAKLHGGVATPKSESVAMMIELIHNATLIHDDVIDEAYTRHGELTVGALLRSRSAVLAGDYLFSRGLSLASQTGAYEELNIAIAAIEALVEGELRQADNARKMVVDRDAYFEVIRLKTASLISAAAQIGAVSVGATPAEQELMREFGHKVGIAFQIQDDILDYTSEKTGKPRYNDIVERKITLPLLCAIERGGTSVLGDIRKGKVERVAEFVEKNGGIEAAIDQNRNIIGEAKAMLDHYEQNEVVASLRMMADFAGIREK